MFPRKAAQCELCGKSMGFIGGMRGFGLREAGHARRCAARMAGKASVTEGSMVSNLSTTVCSSPTRNPGFAIEEETFSEEACGSSPPDSPTQAESPEAPEEDVEVVTEQVVLAPFPSQDVAAEVLVKTAGTEVPAEVLAEVEAELPAEVPVELPAKLPAEAVVEKVTAEAAVQKVTAETSAATGPFAALCCHRRRATVALQSSGK